MCGGTEGVLSTTIIAIKLVTDGKQRILGVAYVDQGMKKLGVCEFIENDQFSNLEVSCHLTFLLKCQIVCILKALLVQLSPKEGLVVANDANADAGKIRQALQRANVMITERKRCKEVTHAPPLSSKLRIVCSYNDCSK